MTFHVQPVLVLGNSQARLIVNVPQNSGISLQLHSVYVKYKSILKINRIKLIDSLPPNMRFVSWTHGKRL